MLTPSQSLKFLGFILDSVSMTVTLTLEKKEQITSLCTEALNGDFSQFVLLLRSLVKLYLPYKGLNLVDCTIVI